MGNMKVHRTQGVRCLTPTVPFQLSHILADLFRFERRTSPKRRTVQSLTFPQFARSHLQARG